MEEDGANPRVDVALARSANVEMLNLTIVLLNYVINNIIYLM